VLTIANGHASAHAPANGANGTHPALPPLTDRHLADLRDSGLSDEQIEACGFHSLRTAAEVEKVLRWKSYDGSLGPCLCIPFFDPDGKPMAGYSRLKPDRPMKRESGDRPKYETPKGSSNRAYLPPGTRAALADPRVELVITEGEKKAAKADQEGFPCIGLVGVYGWHKKRQRGADGKAQGDRELIGDLAGIAWRGRSVKICFDSDAVTNPNVRDAESHLAEALQKQGAAVLVVRLPPGPSDAKGKPGKVGLDDYLVAHGPDAFRRLLAAATEPAKPNTQPASPTGVQVILAYYRERYRPVFKRGNSIHTADGRDVPMTEAVAVADSDLIAQLYKAKDAPRDGEGNVKRSNLPRFFTTWAKVAWGDLLKLLPDEDQAELGNVELAAEDFRRLVRDALLTEIVLGTVVRGGMDDVTQTERRSLIEWCERFAKAGPWRSIRSKKCWCKTRDLGGGEIELMVAVRHELFAQLKADRRLCEMGPNRFSRRAERYGVGKPDPDERPHGQRAVVLSREFVADLTAGLPEPVEPAADDLFTEAERQQAAIDNLRGPGLTP
jgi:hypothetical protein